VKIEFFLFFHKRLIFCRIWIALTGYECAVMIFPNMIILLFFGIKKGKATYGFLSERLPVVVKLMLNGKQSSLE